MRKFCKAALLSTVAVVLIAAPVLALMYQAPFTIIEDAGVDYDMFPALVGAKNTFMAANGFMEADALDTRVETLAGSDKPHMVADTFTLAAVPIDANSQTNLFFTTGETDLASMNILLGYGGFITIPDAAALEPGDDFEFEFQDTYINTDAGAGKDLLLKTDAIEITTSAGDISATLLGQGAAPTVAAVNGGDDNVDQNNHTVNLPAGISAGDLLLVFFATDSAAAITFPNEGVDWIQLFERARGGDVNGGAWYRIADGGEGATIIVTTATAQRTAHTSYRITDYTLVPEAAAGADGSSANPNPPNLAPTWGALNTLWFAVSYNDGSRIVNAYPANYTDGRNDTPVAGTGAGVGSARRELNAAAENPGTFTLSGVEDGVANTIAVAPGDLTVTAINQASGEHDVSVTADTVNLEISIDGAVAGDGFDSAALAGASVTDNANDWLLMDNSTTQFMPYMASYKHTVGGVLIAHYQPIAIVENTGEASTADAGTATTLDDAILTQANDFWIGAKLIIVTTTDGFAPEGESSAVTDFDAALDRLTFGALTAVVDAGDTYTIDFGTLVDRQGGDEDARITWGVNPTGISVTLGSMVAESQPIIGETVEAPARDILPPITVSDWFGDGTVSGATLTNPIRPLITAMSDNTTLTEIQVWRLMGIIAVLFATVATAFTIRQHQGITAIVAGTMLGGLVAFDSNIFPMWTLVIATGLFIAGVVAERSPSL